MDKDRPGAWLPLAEAALRLGTTVDAVRKRVRREQIPARRGNDGKVHVLVGGQPPASHNLDDGQPAVGLLVDLEEAREQAERWRVAAEEARVDAAGLRAERDAARELVRSLEEQVRWLRRPFWRRWLDKD
jgi:hypothetical protein